MIDMKPNNKLNVLFLSLLIFCDITSNRIYAADPEATVRVSTPEQLLAVVNSRLKKMHHSLFTMDGLTVWVARQIDASECNGKPRGMLDTLLENLVEKKRFEYPVEVRSEEYRSIVWKIGDSDYKEIALPPHICLEIAICDHVNNVGKEGFPIKVFWSSVIIASDLLDHIK